MSAKKKNNKNNNQSKIDKENKSTKNENKTVENAKNEEKQPKVDEKKVDTTKGKNNTKEKVNSSQAVKKVETKKESPVDTNKTKNNNTRNIKNTNTKNANTKSTGKKTVKKEPETKEEEVVFKNSNSKKKTNSEKTKNNKEQTQKTPKDNIAKKESPKIDKATEKKVEVPEKEVTNNINTPEFFEEKKKHKRKIFLIITNVICVLIILLVFSTIFAIIQTLKPTIARGVKIYDIDVSNLTYDEAKEKLEEAFNVVLDNRIEFKYKDYSYVMKSSEISLSYNLNDALEKAYNVGRSENIIQNNYEILCVALFSKNIDFKFDYNDEELNKVVEYISTSVPDLVMQYSYYIEGNDLIINPGKNGITVNKEELKNKVLDNISTKNPVELVKDYKNTNIDIPYTDVVADSIDIDKVYSEVHSEPKDAYYTEKTETTDFAIYPDEDGIDFAISIDEAKEIVKQDGTTEYIVPLNRTAAQVKINDIGIEAFPDLLSTYSTRYDASLINRSENLRIAASKINGKVVLPGETFSYNAVVGERTVAEGYKDAKIFSDGQVVDGLAGGICQISSTLYNAALGANLQIDERYNHSFATSYVPLGRDATVVYGVKDLKFTNNRKYPIKIEASVSNGVAVFNINGIKEEKEYKVDIIPVKTATIPYTVKTIVDNTLPVGAVQLSQAGAPGYRVTTYKQVSLNGVVISKEVISNDVYKVMTRILRVGPTQ